MSLLSFVSCETALDMIRKADRWEVFIPWADMYVEISMGNAIQLVQACKADDEASTDVKSQVLCHAHKEATGITTIRLG